MLRGISTLGRSAVRGSLIKPRSTTFGATRKNVTMFEKFPKKQGLYDKNLEKDSCGVGLVAHLKKQASRQIVIDANQIMVRMSHRGGCGCEVNSGDGAGTYQTRIYHRANDFVHYCSRSFSTNNFVLIHTVFLLLARYTCGYASRLL